MFIVAVMAITLLCLPASGQTTAQDWYNKGLALDNQGRYDEAIQAYDKAIEIDPRDKDIWNNKGIALYDQKRYSEAIQAYDKAIELDPKYAGVWFNKGNGLAKLGLTIESNEAFAKAKELGYPPEPKDRTGSPTPVDLGNGFWLTILMDNLQLMSSDMSQVSTSLSAKDIASTKNYSDLLAMDAEEALQESQSLIVSPEFQNAKNYSELGLSSYQIGAEKVSQSCSLLDSNLMIEGMNYLSKGNEYMELANRSGLFSITAKIERS
jgi:tetratricopeptide (TPR) repeat protein